jgi:hypothetical protein
VRSSSGDHLRRCELYGASDDEKRKRFRQFMSKREASANIVIPNAYAVSNVPVRVPTLFMAATMRSPRSRRALKRYEGRVAITALHGLRGVGKTTLAAAYAERHGGELSFPVIVSLLRASCCRRCRIRIGRSSAG